MKRSGIERHGGEEEKAGSEMKQSGIELARRVRTEAERKWLLADTFLFLPETIGRKPAARWSKAESSGTAEKKRKPAAR